MINNPDNAKLLLKFGANYNLDGVGSLVLLKKGFIPDDFIPFSLDGFGGVLGFKGGSSEVFLIFNGVISIVEKSFHN